MASSSRSEGGKERSVQRKAVISRLALAPVRNAPLST
jgi:hypothetical protein